MPLRLIATTTCDRKPYSDHWRSTFRLKLQHGLITRLHGTQLGRGLKRRIVGVLVLTSCLLKGRGHGGGFR